MQEISKEATYILHQYLAASGGQKMQSTVENAYVSGSVKMMTSCIETDTKVLKSTNSANEAESGSFELWQMNPDMWYVELALGDNKVQAGCNGRLVWRKTSWQLGPHVVKGPPSPLLRTLQGLDPRATARMFAKASYADEKNMNINGEDCFILEINADSQTLKATSDEQTEVMEHTSVGYFSQRTGLLMGLRDSNMKRVQTKEGGSVTWKTTIESLLEDYRPVEGVMIAHSERSEATLVRYGGAAKDSQTMTRMEETWTVQEVAFNVPGLSMDNFTPPAELEACDRPREDRLKRVSRQLSGRGGAALW